MTRQLPPPAIVALPQRTASGQVTKGRRPKKVRDRQLSATLERILAKQSHPCQYRGCVFKEEGHHRGWIAVGTEYVKVFDHTRLRRMGNRIIPTTQVFHYECLPPELRAAADLLERPDGDG